MCVDSCNTLQILGQERPYRPEKNMQEDAGSPDVLPWKQLLLIHSANKYMGGPNDETVLLT